STRGQDGVEPDRSGAARNQRRTAGAEDPAPATLNQRHPGAGPMPAPPPDRRGERAVMSGPAATRPKEGAMNDHILEMRSITKRYPGVVALQDVSLTVREGQIHAICGENGAGKSTLMKVLSGVEPSGTYEGQIVFRDQPVVLTSIDAFEADGIVILHRKLAVIPHQSVAVTIFLGGLQSRGGIISWHETNARAAQLM